MGLLKSQLDFDRTWDQPSKSTGCEPGSRFSSKVNRTDADFRSMIFGPIDLGCEAGSASGTRLIRTAIRLRREPLSILEEYPLQILGNILADTDDIQEDQTVRFSSQTIGKSH
jgi:hypothetical protein